MSDEWQECETCGGDGFDGHDCGEDCCNCLRPEPNVPCRTCGGAGGWKSEPYPEIERAPSRGEGGTPEGGR